MMPYPQGRVIWLTGLSASGKSTLAEILLARLSARRQATLWLDSDDLRGVLTPEPKYTEEERDAFYRALGHLAVLGASGGCTVVVSATAPKRQYRESVRAQVSCFIEVYLRCSETTRRLRDVKGLYTQQDQGQIHTFPGFGAPYEPPEAPELIFDSENLSPAVMASKVLDRLNAPTESPMISLLRAQ